jgi:hypothetical protein
MGLLADSLLFDVLDGVGVALLVTPACFSSGGPIFFSFNLRNNVSLSNGGLSLILLRNLTLDLQRNVHDLNHSSRPQVEFFLLSHST